MTLVRNHLITGSIGKFYIGNMVLNYKNQRPLVLNQSVTRITITITWLCIKLSSYTVKARIPILFSRRPKGLSQRERGPRAPSNDYYLIVRIFRQFPIPFHTLTDTCSIWCLIIGSYAEIKIERPSLYGAITLVKSLSMSVKKFVSGV